MLGLITTLLIDTSIVKIYDIVDKNFIPTYYKVMLFSVNSLTCLIFQYLIVRYLRSSFQKYLFNQAPHSNLFYRIFFISLSLQAISFGFLTSQMFYDNSYYTLMIIMVIIISYLTTSLFLVILSIFFVSWYKSNPSLLVLMYSISILLIVFNLIITVIYTSLNIDDRPDEIRRYVGGSMNISVGRYILLSNIYTVSSILSFVSIWITTAILMKNYKDKLIHALAYWIILSLPLIYYSINYSYRFIFGSVLTDYLTIDPRTVSIILTAFLSLSKPIGGLTFGIVFWRISKSVGYERKIKTYMIISGWGILLLFATDQATSQTLTPYPPFGIATITALILAGYLMLLGIYNSAALVSVNTDLRRSIYKHAFESRLLNLIGRAEADKEIQKTVRRIIQDKEIQKMNAETNVDLDEQELKKHLDFVMREVKKIKDK